MIKMVISCENDCLSEKWYRMFELTAVFQKLPFLFQNRPVLLGYGHFYL